MARIIRHTQCTPIKIDPSAPPGDPAAWPRDEQGNLKKLFICACGLSGKFPICDGSHKAINEEPGHVYRYDPQTRAVTDRQPE
ncbi:MAG: hypothetical protein AMXMBFR58_14460 [Phycisphaerae bacterium]